MERTHAEGKLIETRKENRTSDMGRLVSSLLSNDDDKKRKHWGISLARQLEGTSVPCRRYHVTGSARS